MSVQLGGVSITLGLHPDVLLVCLGLVAGYWALLRRYGGVLFPRRDQQAVSRGQVASFLAGVVALYLAGGPPLHDLADQALFSAHMVEHLAYALVIPPLLLLGIPTWMARRLLAGERVRRAVAWACRPVVAGLAFNLVLVGLHWPAVIEAMLASEAFHLASHTLLLAVAAAMWANVVSPAPELVPRLPPIGQMVYLFLMTIVPTVPASFLTFADSPLYPFYTRVVMPFGLDPVGDLRIAGLIMKIGAGFLLWGVITVVYFRWAAEQERAERQPPDRRHARSST